MQNGPNSMKNTRQPRSAAPFRARSPRPESNAVRDNPRGSQNAQRNYERYLALAQAEVRAGDVVAAENYFQHAEHYFRSMSSNQAVQI
jgi:hypothetical protein